MSVKYRVHQQFNADWLNAPWMTDFLYAPTWRGHMYVAFVIDVFVRRIIGSRATNMMYANFVLATLVRASHA